MTELTHQSQQQAFLILILTKSLKVLTGSTSQVLHLLFQTLPLNLQRLLVKLLKAHGVTVSCDLNFRKKLWTSEKAQKVMSNLMQYVDVCIGNEEDADKVLGFKPENTDVTSGELNLAGYESIFKQMVAKFGFKYVISSLRVSKSASDNGWSACIYSSEDDEFYHSREYRIRQSLTV